MATIATRRCRASRSTSQTGLEVHMTVHDDVDSSYADLRVSRAAGAVRRHGRSARREAPARAVVLRDPELTPGAVLLDTLGAWDLEPEVVRVDRAGRLPDPELLDLAVVLGAARLSGEDAPAWLERELNWLRRADRAGTAILALGSAAHALAIALGGGVRRARRPRRVWTLVSTTAPAMIAAGPWLVWQDDVIVLPPDAEVLAHDHVGPQVFAVNGHLGVQFHPEATPEIVADWVRSNEEVLDFQGIMEASWRELPTAGEKAQRLFAEFVGPVAQARR